jgi:uncharacterized protein
MQLFAELASLPQYRRNNIAVFFEPDPEPLSHDEYHAWFWRILQHLHDVDPDPQADEQPDPSDESWEFSFAGVQTFVVCACPSFRARHSRNLGPGMVLLFQPREVFVDTITNKVIGREARNQVRKRLEAWDEIPAHPDLGFFGDPGNLEWKQYFLDDVNEPAADRCPFLKRQRQQAGEARPVPADHTSRAHEIEHSEPAGPAHSEARLTVPLSSSPGSSGRSPETSDAATRWHPHVAEPSRGFVPRVAPHGAAERRAVDPAHDRRDYSEE